MPSSICGMENNLADNFEVGDVLINDEAIGHGEYFFCARIFYAEHVKLVILVYVDARNHLCVID